MRYVLKVFKNKGFSRLLPFGGYALYLAFSFMAIHSATMLSAVGELAYATQTLFWLCGTVARIAVFLLVFCLARFIAKLPALVVAAVCGSLALASFFILGMIFQFYGMLPSNVFTTWLFLGGALLGVGDVLIVLLWARFLVTLNVRAVYLFVLLSNMLSLVIYFVATLLPEILNVPVAALFFLVSASSVGWLVVKREQDVQSKQGEQGEQRREEISEQKQEGHPFSVAQ